MHKREIERIIENAANAVANAHPEILRSDPSGVTVFFPGPDWFSIQVLAESSTADALKALTWALEAAEAERIALADSYRADLEVMTPMSAASAAMCVQDVIDGARPSS